MLGIQGNPIRRLEGEYSVNRNGRGRLGHSFSLRKQWVSKKRRLIDWNLRQKIILHVVVIGLISGPAS